MLLRRSMEVMQVAELPVSPLSAHRLPFSGFTPRGHPLASRACFRLPRFLVHHSCRSTGSAPKIFVGTLTACFSGLCIGVSVVGESKSASPFSGFRRVLLRQPRRKRERIGGEVPAVGEVCGGIPTPTPEQEGPVAHILYVLGHFSVEGILSERRSDAMHTPLFPPTSSPASMRQIKHV